MLRIARILVVDDDIAITELVRDVLMAEGYAVDIATNGGEALMLVRSSRPDVIILDIKMPDVNGDRVLHELKAFDDSIPVVMLSGSDDEALARDLLRMGAFDYLRKPFSVEALQTTVAVATAVGRHGASGIVVTLRANRRTTPASDGPSFSRATTARPAAR